MTLSIVGWDARSRAVGSAVASRSVAVGGTVAYSRIGVGVVNTQHHADLEIGQRVLGAMERGVAPDAALEEVLREDSGSASRQLVAIDVRGRRGAWTGEKCTPERGHRVGEQCAAAGNFLVDEEVVVRMAAAFEERAALPLDERLLACLRVGVRDGGDRRGHRAAAVRVLPAPGAGIAVNVDLRVDDHEQPVDELVRLLGIFRDEFGP